MSRRMLVAGSSVLATFLLAAFLLLHAMGHSTRGGGPGYALDPKPIVGELVNISDAHRLTDYPIPLLPKATLTDPCTHAATTVSLAQVWTNRELKDRSLRQVALTYNVGLWMTVTPKTWFVDKIASAQELPPAETAFAAFDYPTGTTTGSVRGHTAWVQQSGENLSCGSAQFWAGPPDTASGSEPQCEDAQLRHPMILPRGWPTSSPLPWCRGTGPAHYDGAGSEVRWMENGVVIDLTGPFTIDQLASLARDMRLA
jgi:hypothetical protein